MVDAGSIAIAERIPILSADIFILKELRPSRRVKVTAAFAVQITATTVNAVPSNTLALLTITSAEKFFLPSDATAQRYAASMQATENYTPKAVAPSNTVPNLQFMVVAEPEEVYPLAATLTYSSASIAMLPAR